MIRAVLRTTKLPEWASHSADACQFRKAIINNDLNDRKLRMAGIAIMRLTSVSAEWPPDPARAQNMEPVNAN